MNTHKEDPPVSEQDQSIRPRRFRFLGFFAGLLVLLLVCSVILQHIANTHIHDLADRSSRSAALFQEPEQTIDVLVTGDSESYTSIAPLQMYLELGVCAYDAGYPQQKAEAALWQLYRIFQKQSPKVVLLETNQFFLYEGIVAELGDAFEETMDLIPAIEYHSAWKTLVDPPRAMEQYPVVRGYGIHPAILTSGYPADYMDWPKEVESIHFTTKWCIRQIKSLCDKHGAALVLYTSVSPAFASWGRHDAVTAFANELGVPYLDMNTLCDEVGIDWEVDMLDAGDHVNSSGAERITRYMDEWLAQNYDLPDHRGEAEYAWLDQMAQEYKAQIEPVLTMMRGE